MSVLNEQAVPVVDDALPTPGRGEKKRRPRHVKGTRPGWIVYACLAAVLVGSLFPSTGRC